MMSVHTGKRMLSVIFVSKPVGNKINTIVPKVNACKIPNIQKMCFMKTTKTQDFI